MHNIIYETFIFISYIVLSAVSNPIEEKAVVHKSVQEVLLEYSNSKCPYLKATKLLDSKQTFLNSCPDYTAIKTLTEVTRENANSVACLLYYNNFVSLCDTITNLNVSVVLNNKTIDNALKVYTISTACRDLENVKAVKDVENTEPVLNKLKAPHVCIIVCSEIQDDKVIPICTAAAYAINLTRALQSYKNNLILQHQNKEGNVANPAHPQHKVDVDNPENSHSLQPPLKPTIVKSTVEEAGSNPSFEAGPKDTPTNQNLPKMLPHPDHDVSNSQQKAVLPQTNAESEVAQSPDDRKLPAEQPIEQNQQPSAGVDTKVKVQPPNQPGADTLHKVLPKNEPEKPQGDLAKPQEDLVKPEEDVVKSKGDLLQSKEDQVKSKGNFVKPQEEVAKAVLPPPNTPSENARNSAPSVIQKENNVANADGNADFKGPSDDLLPSSKSISNVPPIVAQENENADNADFMDEDDTRGMAPPQASDDADNEKEGDAPEDDTIMQKPVKSADKVKPNPKPQEIDEDAMIPAYSGSNTDEEDSFFFIYFMMVCAVFILGYIGYHNKQKVLALVVEGRRGRRGSRRGRPNSANYHKLDSNLEEAVTSSCNKNTTNIIY